MSKAQILIHRYFDAAWNQGKTGKDYSDTGLPEHKELVGYVLDLEQRLADAEAKLAETDKALRWVCDEPYSREHSRKALIISRPLLHNI